MDNQTEDGIGVLVINSMASLPQDVVDDIKRLSARLTYLMIPFEIMVCPVLVDVAEKENVVSYGNLIRYYGYFQRPIAIRGSFSSIHPLYMFNPSENMAVIDGRDHAFAGEIDCPRNDVASTKADLKDTKEKIGKFFRASRSVPETEGNDKGDPLGFLFNR